MNTQLKEISKVWPDIQNIFSVDTNIWLYSFIKSQDEEKSKIAKSIIAGSDIIISTQIINVGQVETVNDDSGF